MSAKHPIVAVTGSSAAGTSVVRRSFEHIFKHEGIRAEFVKGNAFRRYDGATMKRVVARAEELGLLLSHFGPEANLFDRLEGLFREYSRTGTGLVRQYVQSPADAEELGLPRGGFTPWREIEPGADLLFYEGMHGGAIETTWSRRPLSPSHNPIIIRERQKLEHEEDQGVDVARWVDLLIGVAPVINLEWIQKMHRDHFGKGASQESITHTIMRRLEDYIRYITPQFSLTDVNFQRIPMVDTSNPFRVREIPTLAESKLVVRFREPKGVNFPDLLNRIPNSEMTRRNTLLIEGGDMEMAMDIICTPIIHRLIERKRAADRRIENLRKGKP